MSVTVSATHLMIPDIERFFQFLDSPTEIFCYAFFDHESKNIIKGHGVKFGILPEIIEECQKFTQPFTLHTTLNRTKLTGRKRKDIESVRCLCVDFDDYLEPEQARKIREDFKPHMVVKTSPGKYHFYWKLDSLITLPQWSTFQLGLAHYFNADQNLAEPHHTIRVPGVSRICKDGERFMPSIVYLADSALITSLTYDSVLDRFPFIIKHSKLAEKAKSEKRKTVRSTLKQIKKDGGEVNFEKLVGANNRNDSLFSLIYAYASDKSDDNDFTGACQLAGEFNQALSGHEKGPLELDELDKTVQSAFDSGTKKREEREARNKEKLKKLGVMEVEQVEHVNGEIKTDNRAYVYDYSGVLGTNRFSDRAIAEMVMQRFRHFLFRIGKITYAFDLMNEVWRNQKGIHDVIQSYVCLCSEDMEKDPELIAQRCTSENGEISMQKIQREKDRLSSFRLISQAVQHVLHHPNIRRVTFFDFDKDPYLLNVKNGALNLLSGSIRPATAEDMFLRQAPVVFDPEAKCPYFEQFISEVFAQNTNPLETIRFIQELFGYSLTGSIGEQTIFIHVGDGANGKSRVLGALSTLLGEYSARLDPTSLTKNKNSIEKEIGRLGVKFEGKRVTIIDDLDTKSQWNDSLIKMLTDKILTARSLYEEEREIPNRAKIHIGCNQTPNIEHGGRAMDRRVCIIEYPREFTPSPAKWEEITEAVNRELPGILNWAMEGLKRVMSYPDKKTKWPEEVSIRVEEYQAANAPSELPVDLLFKKTPFGAERHTLNEIMAHVETYCVKNGVPNDFGKERLGIILRKNGFEKAKLHIGKTNITSYFLQFLDENSPEQKFEETM